MNITIERQKEIFHKILSFIEESEYLSMDNYPLPNIDLLSIESATLLSITKYGILMHPAQYDKYEQGIIEDNHNERLNEELVGDNLENALINQSVNIFDILGYFSMISPCSVFLCDELIEKYSKAKNCDKNILTEVVYIHECAHYIHYHLNSANYRNCPFNVNERSLYVETFAQLITHVIAKDLSQEHLSCFKVLLSNQSDVYTRYKDFAIACSKDFLIDLFLNPQQKNKCNIIEFIELNYDIENWDENFMAWDFKALFVVAGNNKKLKLFSQKSINYLLKIDEDKTRFYLNLYSVDLNGIEIPSFSEEDNPGEYTLEDLAELMKDLGDIGHDEYNDMFKI